MKIFNDPFKITYDRSKDRLIDSLKELEEILSRIRSALTEQTEIVDRIEAAGAESKSPEELRGLVDELDRVVSECRLADRALMSGRYSRDSARVSLWFAAGLCMNQMERIAIATMTAKALGFRDGDAITADGENIKQARMRIEKCDAHMRGYLNRIGFIIKLWKELPPGAYRKVFLGKDIKGNQIDMLRSARACMGSTYRVVRRIRQLVREAAGKNDRERQCLQVEVSALVDEIDRIASQAEYNRFKLLLGHYKMEFPTASLWFIQDTDGHKMKRIYIEEVTTESLDITDSKGLMLSLSGSEKSLLKVLDSALKRLSRQRDELAGHIKELERDEEYDLSITVGREG